MIHPLHEPNSKTTSGWNDTPSLGLLDGILPPLPPLGSGWMMFPLSVLSRQFQSGAIANLNEFGNIFEFWNFGRTETPLSFGLQGFDWQDLLWPAMNLDSSESEDVERFDLPRRSEGEGFEKQKKGQKSFAESDFSGIDLDASPSDHISDSNNDSEQSLGETLGAAWYDQSLLAAPSTAEPLGFWDHQEPGVSDLFGEGYDFGLSMPELSRGPVEGQADSEGTSFPDPVEVEHIEGISLEQSPDSNIDLQPEDGLSSADEISAIGPNIAPTAAQFSTQQQFELLTLQDSEPNLNEVYGRLDQDSSLEENDQLQRPLMEQSGQDVVDLPGRSQTNLEPTEILESSELPISEDLLDDSPKNIDVNISENSVFQGDLEPRLEILERTNTVELEPSAESSDISLNDLPVDAQASVDIPSDQPDANFHDAETLPTSTPLESSTVQAVEIQHIEEAFEDAASEAALSTTPEQTEGIVGPEQLPSPLSDHDSLDLLENSELENSQILGGGTDDQELTRPEPTVFISPENFTAENESNSLEEPQNIAALERDGAPSFKHNEDSVLPERLPAGQKEQEQLPDPFVPVQELSEVSVQESEAQEPLLEREHEQSSPEQPEQVSSSIPSETDKPEGGLLNLLNRGVNWFWSQLEKTGTEQSTTTEANSLQSDPPDPQDETGFDADAWLSNLPESTSGSKTGELIERSPTAEGLDNISQPLVEISEGENVLSIKIQEEAEERSQLSEFNRVEPATSREDFAPTDLIESSDVDPVTAEHSEVEVVSQDRVSSPQQNLQADNFPRVDPLQPQNEKILRQELEQPELVNGEIAGVEDETTNEGLVHQALSESTQLETPQPETLQPILSNDLLSGELVPEKSLEAASGFIEEASRNHVQNPVAETNGVVEDPERDPTTPLLGDQGEPIVPSTIEQTQSPRVERETAVTERITEHTQQRLQTPSDIDSVTPTPGEVADLSVVEDSEEAIASIPIVPESVQQNSDLPEVVASTQAEQGVITSESEDTEEAIASNPIESIQPQVRESIAGVSIDDAPALNEADSFLPSEGVEQTSTIEPSIEPRQSVSEKVIPENTQGFAPDRSGIEERSIIQTTVDLSGSSVEQQEQAQLDGQFVPQPTERPESFVQPSFSIPREQDEFIDAESIERDQDSPSDIEPLSQDLRSEGFAAGVEQQQDGLPVSRPLQEESDFSAITSEPIEAFEALSPNLISDGSILDSSILDSSIQREDPAQGIETISSETLSERTPLDEAEEVHQAVEQNFETLPELDRSSQADAEFQEGVQSFNEDISGGSPVQLPPANEVVIPTDVLAVTEPPIAPVLDNSQENSFSVGQDLDAIVPTSDDHVPLEQINSETLSDRPPSNESISEPWVQNEDLAQLPDADVPLEQSQSEDVRKDEPVRPTFEERTIIQTVSELSGPTPTPNDTASPFLEQTHEEAASSSVNPIELAAEGESPILPELEASNESLGPAIQDIPSSQSDQGTLQNLEPAESENQDRFQSSDGSEPEARINDPEFFVNSSEPQNLPVFERGQFFSEVPPVAEGELNFRNTTELQSVNGDEQPEITDSRTAIPNSANFPPGADEFVPDAWSQSEGPSQREDPAQRSQDTVTPTSEDNPLEAISSETLSERTPLDEAEEVHQAVEQNFETSPELDRSSQADAEFQEGVQSFNEDVSGESPVQLPSANEVVIPTDVLAQYRVTDPPIASVVDDVQENSFSVERESDAIAPTLDDHAPLEQINFESLSDRSPSNESVSEPQIQSEDPARSLDAVVPLEPSQSENSTFEDSTDDEPSRPTFAEQTIIQTGSESSAPALHPDNAALPFLEQPNEEAVSSSVDPIEPFAGGEFHIPSGSEASQDVPVDNTNTEANQSFAQDLQDHNEVIRVENLTTEAADSFQPIQSDLDPVVPESVQQNSGLPEPISTPQSEQNAIASEIDPPHPAAHPNETLGSEEQSFETLGSIPLLTDETSSESVMEGLGIDSRVPERLEDQVNGGELSSRSEIEADRAISSTSEQPSFTQSLQSAENAFRPDALVTDESDAIIPSDETQPNTVTIEDSSSSVLEPPSVNEEKPFIEDSTPLQVISNPFNAVGEMGATPAPETAPFIQQETSDIGSSPQLQGSAILPESQPPLESRQDSVVSPADDGVSDLDLNSSSIPSSSIPSNSIQQDNDTDTIADDFPETLTSFESSEFQSFDSSSVENLANDRSDTVPNQVPLEAVTFIQDIPSARSDQDAFQGLEPESENQDRLWSRDSSESEVRVNDPESSVNAGEPQTLFVFEQNQVSPEVSQEAEINLNFRNTTESQSVNNDEQPEVTDSRTAIPNSHDLPSAVDEFVPDPWSQSEAPRQNEAPAQLRSPDIFVSSEEPRSEDVVRAEQVQSIEEQTLIQSESESFSPALDVTEVASSVPQKSDEEIVSIPDPGIQSSEHERQADSAMEASRAKSGENIEVVQTQVQDFQDQPVQDQDLQDQPAQDQSVHNESVLVDNFTNDDERRFQTNQPPAVEAVFSESEQQSSVSPQSISPLQSEQEAIASEIDSNNSSGQQIENSILEEQNIQPPDPIPSSVEAVNEFNRPENTTSTGGSSLEPNSSYVIPDQASTNHFLSSLSPESSQDPITDIQEESVSQSDPMAPQNFDSEAGSQDPTSMMSGQEIFPQPYAQPNNVIAFNLPEESETQSQNELSDSFINSPSIPDYVDSSSAKEEDEQTQFTESETALEPSFSKIDQDLKSNPFGFEERSIIQPLAEESTPVLGVDDEQQQQTAAAFEQLQGKNIQSDQETPFNVHDASIEVKDSDLKHTEKNSSLNDELKTPISGEQVDQSVEKELYSDSTDDEMRVNDASFVDESFVENESVEIDELPLVQGLGEISSLPLIEDANLRSHLVLSEFLEPDSDLETAQEFLETKASNARQRQNESTDTPIQGWTLTPNNAETSTSKEPNQIQKYHFGSDNIPNSWNSLEDLVSFPSLGFDSLQIETNENWKIPSLWSNLDELLNLDQDALNKSFTIDDLGKNNQSVNNYPLNYKWNNLSDIIYSLNNKEQKNNETIEKLNYQDSKKIDSVAYFDKDSNSQIDSNSFLNQYEFMQLVLTELKSTKNLNEDYQSYSYFYSSKDYFDWESQINSSLRKSPQINSVINQLIQEEYEKIAFSRFEDLNWVVMDIVAKISSFDRDEDQAFSRATKIDLF